MEYIVIDKDKIKKFEISFDDKQIIEIRNKVIDECSVIEHEVFEDDYYPFSTKSEEYEYRNIKSLNVKNDDKNEYYIYNYEYDKYIYPYLVKVINRLLQGDKRSIEEIFNYNGLYDTYIIDIDKRINNIIDKLNNDINDIDNSIKIIDTLKGLLLFKKSIILGDNIKKYYDELQKLLSFELKDEITFSDYQRIQEFMNFDYQFNENINYLKK